MHPQGCARRARSELRQARHHARHQRAASARRRQDRSARNEGLPRPARDRPRQPHPAVRSAVSSRAAAHSARAAIRRDRAGSRVRPSADAARRRRTQNAGRQDAGSGRGGARHQLPQLVSDARPRAGRGGGNAPVVAGCLRHHRHGAHARMARVRAHRDGGRERLCRAAGQQVHRGIRFRAAAGRLYRISVADGLARRRHFGRARLPRADHARGVRSGRRLHRRGKLRPSARCR